MTLGNVDLVERLRAYPGLESMKLEELARALYLRDKRTLPEDVKRLIDTASLVRVELSEPDEVSQAIRIATEEVAGVSLGLPADALHYVRTRLAMMRDRELSVDWLPRTDPFDADLLPQLDGLQLDLSRLKAIELDEEAGIVRCGVGASWGEVFEACSSNEWVLPFFPIVPHNPFIGDVIAGTSALFSYRGGPEAYVRNVDFIAPDAKYGESGFDLVPNNSTGYDLNNLMLVAGRHLAVPISMTFSLLPSVSSISTARYPLDRWESLGSLLAGIVSDHISPLKVVFADASGSTLAFAAEGPTLDVALYGPPPVLEAQRRRLDALVGEGSKREDIDGVSYPRVMDSKPAPPILAELRTHVADLDELLKDLGSWIHETGVSMGTAGCLMEGGTVALLILGLASVTRGERVDMLMSLVKMTRKHRCRLRSTPVVQLLAPETNLTRRFTLVRRIKAAIDLPNVINPVGLLWIPRTL